MRETVICEPVRTPPVGRYCGALSSLAAAQLAQVILRELSGTGVDEAFAAQVLARTAEWGFTDADFDRLNVKGAGILLACPVGAQGAQILTTLLHEMQRRKMRDGLETMSIGGGQGLAAIFERAA